MNPIHWFFLIGTVAVSVAFAFYGQWVLWRYAQSSHQTVVTGCEVARFVLDQAGLVHISVAPLGPSMEPSSAEGLLLDPRIYEGRDFLSILQAARQAFLKSQLSNVTFWIRLKKRIAFINWFLVLSGWVLLVLGNFFAPLRFFINLGLGCFCVVMLLAIFDLPFEVEVAERTSALIKRYGHFQHNEMMCLKKINQARAFWGLTAIVLAPFQCFYFLGKNGKIYGSEKSTRIYRNAS
ncbi:MAG TPA: zinc metallopeptidase [Candidatus Omnitrophota bacterium]|nr:zinc metallopeptidase [Candidatus Omnitrophota bacterium]